MSAGHDPCASLPLRRHGDHFLHPGEFHFGAGRARLRTILGSCIALTLWHPRCHIGGMCHYMLPTRLAGAPGASEGLYADGALRFFLQRIRAAGTLAEDYEVKLFGGARMFGDAGAARPIDIGAANLEAGRRMLRANGFTVRREHAGGTGSRDVIFDIGSGFTWVKHVQRAEPDRLAA